MYFRLVIIERRFSISQRYINHASCFTANGNSNMASGSESPKFVRALRRMRPILTRELPDVAVLLKRPELKHHFTGYEISTILSHSLPSQRAEKFIEVLEFKSYDVYQTFTSVLKVLRTDLAVRLEGVEREVSAASTASSPGSSESSPNRT